MGKFTGLMFVVLALPACGDDDCCTGPRDARMESDTPEACLAGTYSVDSIYQATGFAIAGTITFPADLAAGRSVQLETVQVSPTTGNNLKGHVIAAQTGTITYRVKGLPDGTWNVCLRADANGNGSVGEVGVDYVGCYDGTTSAPIKTSSAATMITLGGACRPGIDFGVGVQ